MICCKIELHFATLLLKWCNKFITGSTIFDPIVMCYKCNNNHFKCRSFAYLLENICNLKFNQNLRKDNENAKTLHLQLVDTVHILLVYYKTAWNYTVEYSHFAKTIVFRVYLPFSYVTKKNKISKRKQKCQYPAICIRLSNQI